MPGATLPDGLMVTVYRIPTGTEMLVHRTAHAIPGNYRPKDYVAIVSLKAVTYKDTDVFFNPDTRACTAFTEYGIHLSDYVQDNTHWGFRLPENEKGARFLLVHHRYVTVTKELVFDIEAQKSWSDWQISTSQTKHMADLMDKILKLEERVIEKDKNSQVDLYDSLKVLQKAKKQLQSEFTDAMAKQIDQEIMASVPPLTLTKRIIPVS